ncbi:MAG TPA: hypothetical protein VJC37_00935 [Planctomycetota bacterium]|nr:hypothetical protein [Planctomycetota bacterium]
MDSDLIKLGAYVVIILVIGGASVVKKIIEARKRQQEMEKHRGKTLRLDLERTQQTETQTASRIEEPEREITIESESENPVEKPKIEDILKEIFNIPTAPQKRTPIIKSAQRKQEEKPQAVVQPEMVDASIGEIRPLQVETITASNELSWEVFAAGLKNRGFTEIQRAIVMSEIIQKPKSKRGTF